MSKGLHFEGENAKKGAKGIGDGSSLQQERLADAREHGVEKTIARSLNGDRRLTGSHLGENAGGSDRWWEDTTI